MFLDFERQSTRPKPPVRFVSAEVTNWPLPLTHRQRTLAFSSQGWWESPVELSSVGKRVVLPLENHDHCIFIITNY